MTQQQADDGIPLCMCCILCVFMQIRSCCTLFPSMTHQRLENLSTQTHLLFLCFPSQPSSYSCYSVSSPATSTSHTLPSSSLSLRGVSTEQKVPGDKTENGVAVTDRLCIHLASTAWTQTGGEGVDAGERRKGRN